MKEERNNTNTPKHHKTRNHKTDYNKIINNVITTIYKASNVIPNLAAIGLRHIQYHVEFITRTINISALRHVH